MSTLVFSKYERRHGVSQIPGLQQAIATARVDREYRRWRYQNERSSAVNDYRTVRRIEILIDADNAALFGPEVDATDGIDVRASRAALASSTEQAVRAEYPNAEIEIVASGLGSACRVNGDADHPECMAIDNIVEDVWAAWDWLVSA